MFYYEYWLTFYDVIDDVEEDSSGVVAGNTLKEAIAHITEYYGDEDILKLEIRSSDSEEVYEIPLEKKEKNYDI